jgi:tetratricopeptide (TPR) repeat protein
MAARRGPVADDLLHSRQLTARAAAAIDRGQWLEAEKLLAEAVGSCAIDPESRRLYADVLAQVGDSASALAQLEAAIALVPDDAGLRIRQGELHLARGDYGAARQSASQAVLLDPLQARAWMLWARLARAQGDTPSALRHYRRVIELEPQHRDALREMAQVHYTLAAADAQGRASHLQQALLALHNLHDTFPQGEEPQETLLLAGMVYHDMQRLDEARDSLLAALGREGPQGIEILHRLASIEWQLGRPQQALAAAREAVRRAPQHASSRELLRHYEMAAAASGTLWR